MHKHYEPDKKKFSVRNVLFFFRLGNIITLESREENFQNVLH